MTNIARLAGVGRAWTELEFETFLTSRGGIASRRELLEAGWTADDLRLARGMYGRPERLRHGWYCSRELPPIIRRAWAHGGPLACVSALEWYGAITREREPGGLEALHVCVPRHTRGRTVEAREPLPVVVHWHGAAQDPLSRWAVPLDVARSQARFCNR